MTGTRYKKSIKEPSLNMLKSGKSNAKLGGMVTAKMWRGMPLYQLTLEERATCPTSCDQWDNCYGNNMPFGHRFDHTHPDFLKQLATNIGQLAAKHSQGFVVRLHVLGDFYSVNYVVFWAKMLAEHPGLNVYGYTHRIPRSTIGKQISALNKSHPARWVVRFSDEWGTTLSANVISSADTAYDKATQIICPEQLDKVDSCAACGLCWMQPNRQILFVEH